MDFGMIFGATLKNNSPIFRNWRSQGLLKGHLEGVEFRYTGVHYVVDQVPGGKVTVLLAHNNVVVHVIAPASAPVEEQQEPVEVVPEAPKPRGRPPLSRKS